MLESDILLKYYFDRDAYDFDEDRDKISMTLPVNRVKLGMGKYVSLDKEDIKVEANDYGIVIDMLSIEKKIIIPFNKVLNKKSVNVTYRNGILNIEGKFKKVK